MIVRADARRIPLPDESVQCVVTSPPYWGLRKYKGDQDLIWATGLSAPEGHGNSCACGAWRGAFGLEPTVEMYVAHTVEILREIRRVLRKDGVVFWNVGDSYNSQSGQGIGAREYRPGSGRADGLVDKRAQRNRNGVGDSALKPKDLCLIPARVALAAQQDSWWVRSLIIWAKPNLMPESVTDRPTDAYEHILMLTKSERYFWDAEAVKEKATESTMTRVALAESRKGEAENQSNVAQVKRCESAAVARDIYANPTDHLVCAPNGGMRNMRNVWTFPTQAYSGAHFATFPEEIPRRAILAATSARGACVKCGAPWRRITEKEELQPVDYDGKWSEEPENSSGRRMLANLHASREAGYGDTFAPVKTIGWEPTCECEKETGRLPETAACLVLDPFGGSGTTGRVAIELNRRAVLLDLAYSAEAYAPLAQERLRDVQREMFA